MPLTIGPKNRKLQGKLQLFAAGLWGATPAQDLRPLRYSGSGSGLTTPMCRPPTNFHLRVRGRQVIGLGFSLGLPSQLNANTRIPY